MNPKMKILLLGYTFPPALGGMEKLLGQVADACDPGRIAVLAGGDNSHDEIKFDKSRNYPITRLKLEPESFRDKAFLKLHSLYADLPRAFYNHCYRRSIATARAMVSKYDPQIILCGWAYLLKTAAELKTRNRKIMAIAYGTELMEARTSDYLKQLWKQPDKIFAISNFTKRTLIEMGVSPERIKVTFWGVDPSMADLPRVNPDLAGRGLENKKIILTLCRLVPHKGTDMLIEAMPKILAKVPRAALVVAGDGPYLPELEDKVLSMGLDEAVLIIGRVSTEEKYGWLNACDLYAMPSRYDSTTGGIEGYGYSFLEAGVFTKPVLGGTIGGSPDAVEDGKTGILVDPENVNEIAEAIIGLLEDDAKAQAMGKAGRKRVETERNGKNCINAFLKEIFQPD